MSLLRQMGALVDVGTDSVTVESRPLRAISAELTDSIDLLPVLVVLAAAAAGESDLRGIGRARLKESDRVAGLADGLRRMGIEVVVEKPRMLVTGGIPRPAVIDPHGDHRLAMAFGVLGTLTDGTTIEDAGCVGKTFPDFWDMLRRLGVEVRTV